MRADSVACERAAEVREAAEGWRRAGAIGTPTYDAIRNAYPDPCVTPSAVWRILTACMVTAVMLSTFGALFVGLRPGATALSLLLIVLGAAAVVVTECLEASPRSARRGAAGATGLAAMLKEPERYAGRKVGLVLSGGNIDTRLLAAIMVRELERDDRIVAFRLTTSDRPGLLGRIASLLGEEGANILEVSHGRLFLDVPAKGVTLDVTVETRGAAHSRAIEDALAKNGFAPRRILPRGLAEPAR